MVALREDTASGKLSSRFMRFPRRHLRKRTFLTVAVVVPLLFQLLREGWIVSSQQAQQLQQLDFSSSSSYYYDRFFRSVLAPHNIIVGAASSNSSVIPAAAEEAVAASTHTHSNNHNLSTTTPTTPSAPPPPTPLAACLLFKDDNDLFQEWLAYHYTMFSLRYLIVGEDYHNSHNPRSILHLYNDSNLQYWIWPPDHFTSLKHTVSGNVTKFQAHRALVVRQKHFVTQCLKFVQTQLLPNVTWTALIDPDEYLVVRSLHNNDDKANDQLHHNHTQPPPQHTRPTSKDALPIPFHFASDGGGPSCLTLPRLLIGPLENRSCVPKSALSTLRFAQHAAPHDFAYSGYAKAIVDVSRLSLPSSGIKSIHRPVNACPHAGITLHQHVQQQQQQQQKQKQQSSLIYYLHHYHGSWEQYVARGDARRDSTEWQRRQHVNAGIVDCIAQQQWVSTFVQSGPPAAVQALRNVAGTLPFLDDGVNG